MDERYIARGNSPPRRTARYLDTHASTGTVISSAFDTRYQPQHRPSLDSSRVLDVGYETQPYARKMYVDSGYGGNTASRTQYIVRPRKESITGENRRPASTLILPPSPARSRPVITTTFDPRDSRDLRDSRDFRERPRSPVSKAIRRDDTTYLSPLPASPARNHQRHHSATPAEMDRLTVARRDRDGRDRANTGYHRTGDARQSGNPVASSRGPIRIADDDVSYTGPREQFDRDYPSSKPPRRESYTRGNRPISIMGPPESKPSRERRETREGPPPAISRQTEWTDRPETLRRVGHESESDRERDAQTKRRNSNRNPIVHQSRDEDYVRRGPLKPSRDRYEEDSRPPRDRDYDKYERPTEPRRLPRSRETSPVGESKLVTRSRESSPDHRSGLNKGLAAVGIGGIAAAGLGAARYKDSREKSEDSDSERRKERRRRKHRSRYHDDEETSVADPEIRPERSIPEEKTNGKVEAEEDENRKHRKHRRRRHRRKDEHEQDVASESSSDKPVKYPNNDEDAPLRKEASETGDPEEQTWDRPREILPAAQQRTLSPGDDEDDRPRRVALVEPPKEEERPKPKGILKQRLVPFPEEANPVREGVAPLKEAGKDGVPPGARWTKINRVLVNPEALEKSKERFEEREDYVIVLRVLTKEEIAKLAEKTREIREAREAAWREEYERKNKSKERHRSRGSYPSEEDEEVKAPLAIEAPPPAPETWPLAHHDPLGRSFPENPIPGISGLGLGVVPETYSTHV